MELKKKITEWRSQNGLTQKSAAEYLNITQSNLSRILNGKHKTQPRKAQKYTFLIDNYNKLSHLPDDTTDIVPLRTPAVDDQTHTEVARSSMPFNSFAFDEIRPQLSAYQPRDMEKFRRMNARVKRALGTLTDATFWVDSKVKADADNDYDRDPNYRLRDEILVELFTLQLKRLKRPQSFRSSMQSQLEASMALGFGVSEPVWENERGIWWIKSLKSKPTWDFHPWTDHYENLIGIFHFPTGQLIHPDRLVFTVWPYVHMGNYLGIPETEAIRQDVESLNKNVESRDKFIQKIGVLPIIHKMDVIKMSDTEIARRIDQVNKLESMSVFHTSGMRNPEKGTIEADSELETVPTQTSGPVLSLMSQAISERDAGILHDLGIPNGMGISDDNAHSFAASRVQFDAFIARPDNAQKWISHYVEEQLFKLMLRYNYPTWLADHDYNPPRFVFEAIDEEALERRDSNIRENLKAGIITLEEARAELGLGELNMEVGQVEVSE